MKQFPRFWSRFKRFPKPNALKERIHSPDKIISIIFGYFRDASQPCARSSPPNATGIKPQKVKIIDRESRSDSGFHKSTTFERWRETKRNVGLLLLVFGSVSDVARRELPRSVELVLALRVGSVVLLRTHVGHENAFGIGWRCCVSPE